MSNKYNAKKAQRKLGNDIFYFDSKAEANYFDKLTQLLKKGEISNLSTQPSFNISLGYKIKTNTTKSGVSKIGDMKYTPDFRYIDKNGKNVVVEVKGFADTSYKMRKKLFLKDAHKWHDTDIFVEVIKGKENIYYCDTVIYN